MPYQKYEALPDEMHDGARLYLPTYVHGNPRAQQQTPVALAPSHAPHPEPYHHREIYASPPRKPMRVHTHHAREQPSHMHARNTTLVDDDNVGAAPPAHAANPAHLSCSTVYAHVTSCPLCKKIYGCDSAWPWMVAVAILVCICLFLARQLFVQSSY